MWKTTNCRESFVVCSALISLRFLPVFGGETPAAQGGPGAAGVFCGGPLCGNLELSDQFLEPLRGLGELLRLGRDLRDRFA